MASEVERIRYLTAEVFGDQSGNWSTSTPGGAAIALVGGADRRDDAAWFRIRGDVDLVFASDYVRGTRFALFERGVLSYFDLGYYLISANVSDIAAMGARPIGVTTVVRYPIDLPDDQFRMIFEGIAAACAEYRIENVGGDIGSAERVILSASAIGVADVDQVVPRSGARVGDLVAVSGPTGIAAAALVYSEDSGRGDRLPDVDEARLFDAWRRPRAAVELGEYLGSKRMATSCQDTSDGLKATLEELGLQSGVGFEVDRAALPIDPLVERVASMFGRDVVDLACGASVDFRLAFTLPPGPQVDELLCRFPNVRVIGRATEEREVVLREGINGVRRPLPGSPWLHTS